jgi:hypothetical protein
VNYKFFSDVFHYLFAQLASMNLKYYLLGTTGKP